MSEHRKAQNVANDAVAALSDAINGRTNADALANALMHEHPTLLGQIAKAVGIGVMRRTVRDETWRPFDTTVGGPERIRACSLPAIGINNTQHPEHDGRLDCATVIGADLMARQSFI